MKMTYELKIAPNMLSGFFTSLTLFRSIPSLTPNAGNLGITFFCEIYLLEN